MGLEFVLFQELPIRTKGGVKTWESGVSFSCLKVRLTENKQLLMTQLFLRVLTAGGAVRDTDEKLGGSLLKA